MRENLVLQQRMSRSGKVVHRWVRPPQPVPGAAAIPSATAPHPQRAEWLADLRPLMDEWHTEIYSPPFDEADPEWYSPDDFLRRLDALDDSVLSAGHSLILERQGRGFEDMLGASILKQDDTKAALYVLYLAALEDDVRMLDIETSATFGDVPLGYVTLMSSYKGLLEYGFGLPENPFEASEEDRLRIKALIRVMEELDDADMSAHVHLVGIGLDGHAKLRDRGLAQLVYDRAEDHERIARIIVERNTGDVDLIRSILDSDAAALSDGTL